MAIKIDRKALAKAARHTGFVERETMKTPRPLIEGGTTTDSRVLQGRKPTDPAEASIDSGATSTNYWRL